MKILGASWLLLMTVGLCLVKGNLQPGLITTTIISLPYFYIPYSISYSYFINQTFPIQAPAPSLYYCKTNLIVFSIFNKQRATTRSHNPPGSFLEQTGQEAERIPWFDEPSYDDVWEGEIEENK